MQWFVLGLFACFLNVQGRVIVCSPENPESCAQESALLEAKTALDEECQPGSEWESNCHFCRCSESGLAFCERQESCTEGLAEPLRCKPNTSFRRDCNECICLDSGLGLCTLKNCRSSDTPAIDVASAEFPEIDSEIENQHDIELSDKEEYVPNIKAFDSNNVHNNANIFEESETNDGDDIYGVSGNNHRIIEDIKEDRIVRKEHRILDEDHSILKRSVCKPNQAFVAECNACKCSADGQSYTCTHNECMDGETNKEVEVFMENEGVDHIERHSVCKPRGVFYIGCNTCHCNPYGTDYSCTNKPCPLPEDVELFHELRGTKSSKNGSQKIVCVANRMFIKDCNTCWCNEEGTGFFCTRKVCVGEFPDDADKPEELRIIKKECRPDEVFELDCNMCRCNSDGKSFSCTRRACVEPVDEDLKNSTHIRKTRGAQEPPAKKCQPGLEFRLDCNKCLCDDKGADFACTRIDCTIPDYSPSESVRTKRDTSEQETIECKPNSVFDRDCNVCRCTADGHFATCTTKRCGGIISNNHDNAVSSNPSEGGDSDFRCNPGEQFKRRCNDCSCSADGKNVLCTVRFCDQDITPPSF